MSIKYIVTGTGRCGTMFLSKYLTSAGIDCSHEVIFTNSGINSVSKNLALNNFLQAESSYMAAPYLNHTSLKDAKIIHVVRDPIKVLNSFVSGYVYFLSPILKCVPCPYVWTYEYPPGADPEFKFMKFIYSHVPELASIKLSAIERAALYYIEWNKMIEASCVGRDCLLFPIESNLDILNKFIGIENSDKLHSDKKTNNCEYENKFSLSSINSSIIKSNLFTMGSRYGYFRNLTL